MNMENIRERAISIKPNGKNYLVRAIQAMVKKAKQGIEKAEDNPVRTQLWANVVLTLSVSMAIPFFAWLGFHLVDFGEQKANQKFLQQQSEGYKQVIEQQKKEIEALKQQQSTEDVKTTPPQKKKPAQQTSRNRGRLNGTNKLYTDSSNRTVNVKELSKEGR